MIGCINNLHKWCNEDCPKPNGSKYIRVYTIKEFCITTLEDKVHTDWTLMFRVLTSDLFHTIRSFESFARYFICRNYSNILKLMIYWFLNLEFLNKVIHDLFCLSSWHFSPELTLYAHNTPEKSALLKTSPQGDEGKQGEDTLSLSQHFLWCKTGRGFRDLGAKL